MKMSFREVNDDILKEFWEYRDQTEFAFMTKEDKKHMIQLVEYIRQHKELNAILVVFNFQQVRFPYNMQTMLKLFCKT